MKAIEYTGDHNAYDRAWSRYLRGESFAVSFRQEWKAAKQ